MLFVQIDCTLKRLQSQMIFSKVDDINFGIVKIFYFNIYYPRACIFVYKRVQREFDFQNKTSVVEIIKRTIHKAALCMFLGLLSHSGDLLQ